MGNFFNITFEKVEDHLEDILIGMKLATTCALESVGVQAEAYAKKKCPVDTGLLRSSITHVYDKTSAYIGTNVVYAPYVEFGTSRQKPQPFLRPAALDHAQEYKQIFEYYYHHVSL